MTLFYLKSIPVLFNRTLRPQLEWHKIILCFFVVPVWNLSNPVQDFPFLWESCLNPRDVCLLSDPLRRQTVLSSLCSILNLFVSQNIYEIQNLSVVRKWIFELRKVRFKVLLIQDCATFDKLHNYIIYFHPPTL